MARVSSWVWTLCILTVTLARVTAQEAGYVVFADNDGGSYLRETTSSKVPLSIGAMSVALTSLLDLPPAILTNEDLAYQVDSILAPNPFSRPDAVISLQVYGGEDFLSDSENVAECCCGHAHHIRPLQQGDDSMGTLNTAMMSVASHTGGPSLVHTDLDCDRIADVCDQTCQEAALEALAGYVGGQYERSGVPMQGKLIHGPWTLDLGNVPERELALELVCLVQAAEGPWGVKPKLTSAEPAAPTPRHLLTGTLDSLKAVHDAYGKESHNYMAGSKLLARAIGMAKKAAHKTFGNKLVSQLALFGHSSKLPSKTDGSPQRRLLLEDEASVAVRDVDAWLSTFMALSVGFFLVVATVLATFCMFSLEFKQDTILYGKGKTD